MAHLDTHVVLWLASGRPDQISATAAAAIDDERPVISGMVELELALLHEVGRIVDPAHVVIASLGERIGLQRSTLPFAEVAARAAHLTWTRDPFDRLIVADSLVAGEGLVTKDRAIRQHLESAIW